MNRYFFNFRHGDEISRDRVGMHLHNLDAARVQALYAWREVVAISAQEDEALRDCEIQTANESGEMVLIIPFGEQTRPH